MNLGYKRTLMVAVALSTFFAATLSYSRQKSRLNQRVMTETPSDAGETKSDAKTVTNDGDKQLVCRTGALAVGTRYLEESLWTSGGTSQIPVPLMKSGTGTTVNCMAAVPPLRTDAEPVTGGQISIWCVDGVIKVLKNECLGRTIAMIKAEQEAAAKAAELKRIADAEEAAKVAEAKRIADAEAARVAAEQAAAAAAAECPNNCGGATGSISGGTSGKGGSSDRWTVSYQACNNGQKIVRSSGNSAYATGACYNSIPK